MTIPVFADNTLLYAAQLNALGDEITSAQATAAAAAAAAVFTQAGTGAVPRTMQSKAGETVSVTDFGAVGNNSGDQTAAIQAALDSGASRVIVPRGTFRIEGTLLMRANGLELCGQGSNAAASYLRFVAGADPSAPGIIMGTLGVSRGNLALRDLQITDINRTGATMVRIESCSQVDVDRVVLSTPHNGFEITGCNTVRLYRVHGTSVKGSHFIKWFGSLSGGTKCDILVLNEVQCAPFNTTGTDRAIALWCDGSAQTLVINGFRAVRMGRGILATNSGGVAGEVPAIAFINDLEVDFPEYEAIRLEEATGFRVVNSYAHGSALSDVFYIGPNTVNIEWHVGNITAGWLRGVNVLGKEVVINGTVARNSLSSTGTYAGIEVGATAANVRIGGASGRRGNLTGLQNYGVTVLAGATNVLIAGADLTGNTVGALSNGATAGQVVVRGCVGVADVYATTPAITGSRGSNAALASLLTALAAQGIITDGTSA